jgi:hypothetical protein
MYAPKVAGQIETPRPPDPIMRRPCADREEKRGTCGRDTRQKSKRKSLTSTAPIREDSQESQFSMCACWLNTWPCRMSVCALSIFESPGTSVGRPLA